MHTARLVRSLFLVALLATQGCAYNAAMSRGNRAADNSNWPKAYEAYSDAFKMKGTEESSAAMRDAQSKALEQWDRTARSAVEQGDWKVVAKTWELVTEVSGEDEPLVHNLKKAIGEGLAADVVKKVDNDQPVEAYDIALASKELFPGELFTETALDKVRYYYRSRAEELAAEGRYEESHAALQTITDREPDRAENLAFQRAQMEAGWADQLVERAQAKAKEGRPGTAAVYFAHAHELLKRPNDLKKAQELAEEAKKEGALRVYAKYDGNYARKKDLQSRLESHIEDIAGALVASSSAKGNLGLDLSVGEANCSESKDTKREDREYVSGQIDVPNEPYVEIETQLNSALEDQKAAQAEIDKLKGPYEEARKKLRKMTDTVDSAKKDQETAKRQLARAQKNLDEQQTLVAKLEKELDGAGSAEDKARLQTKVAAIAENVAEWKQEVARWQKSLDESTAQLSQTQSERAPVADEHTRLKNSYDETDRKLAEATQRVSDLNSEASRLPKTVKQDVNEVFSYDVYTWTRTCNAPLYATAMPSWPSELEKSLKLSAEKTEKDTEHIGHRPSRLEADPKGFVQDKNDLIGDADAENRAKLHEWVDTLVKEYYADRVATVKKALGRGPDAATEAAVDLYIAGGSYLDEETRKQIEAFLAKHHGISKPSVLMGEGGYTPPPDIDDF